MCNSSAERDGEQNKTKAPLHALQYYARRCSLLLQTE